MIEGRSHPSNSTQANNREITTNLSNPFSNLKVEPIKSPKEWTDDFQNLLESLKQMGCRQDELSELQAQQQRLQSKMMQFKAIKKSSIKTSQFNFDSQIVDT